MGSTSSHETKAVAALLQDSEIVVSSARREAPVREQAGFMDHECEVKAASSSPSKPQKLTSSSPSKPQKLKSSVTLRVYDPSWVASIAPVNAVHVGVEVYNAEFSFGFNGVRACRPGAYEAYKFRAAVALGKTELTARQISYVLSELRKVWLPEEYRLIGRNCQSFAIAFCAKLGISENDLPSEYLRFAGDAQMPSAASVVDFILPFALSDAMPGGQFQCHCSSVILPSHCNARSAAPFRVPPAPPEQDDIPNCGLPCASPRIPQPSQCVCDDPVTPEEYIDVDRPTHTLPPMHHLALTSSFSSVKPTAQMPTLPPDDMDASLSWMPPIDNEQPAIRL